MNRIIAQFYVEQADASFITLAEDMPATKFTKLKIDGEERELVPFHVGYKKPSMEKIRRVLAVKGGGDLLGKEVVFI